VADALVAMAVWAVAGVAVGAAEQAVADLVEVG